LTQGKRTGTGAHSGKDVPFPPSLGVHSFQTLINPWIDTVAVDKWCCMPHIDISDQVYDELERLKEEKGCKSFDAVVRVLLIQSGELS